MGKNIFTQFMLFVGFPWLLLICVAGLHVLAHLWAAERSAVCITWGLNGVAGSSLHSWLLPTLSAVFCPALYAYLLASPNPWEMHGSLPFQIQAVSDVLFLSPTSISIFYLLQWEAGINKHP